MNSLKISFDFDGTLSNKNVQRFVKLLKALKPNHEYWILTSRYSDEFQNSEYNFLNISNCNGDLFFIAKILNIPNDKIIFTNSEWKFKIVKKMNFNIHIDDNIAEIQKIKRNTKTAAIDILNDKWIEKLVSLIEYFEKSSEIAS